MINIRKTDIQNRIEQLSPWSHIIKLTDDISTPGKHLRPWPGIREIFDHIDFHHKDVLDIGAGEGMWTFEAEDRGALNLTAIDARTNSLEKFNFAAQVRSSRAKYVVTPVQHLPTRAITPDLPSTYDIVLHLSVLPHLNDPLLSLCNARRMMRPGGILILSTMHVRGNLPSVLFTNGYTDNYHWGDASCVWAATRSCLEDMLHRAGFIPHQPEKWVEDGPVTENMRTQIQTGRICLMAKADGIEKLDPLERNRLEGLV